MIKASVDYLMVIHTASFRALASMMLKAFLSQNILRANKSTKKIPNLGMFCPQGGNIAFH